MAQAQKNPFNPWEAWSEMQQNMPKFPGADMNAWKDMADRNMEAMNKANQIAAESFQTMAKKTAEIMQQNTQDGLECFRDACSSKSPEEVQSRCTDYMNSVMKSCSGHAKESTDMASKTCEEIVSICSKRASEATSEWSKSSKKDK